MIASWSTTGEPSDDYTALRDQAVVATYTYDDQGRRVRVQTTSAASQGAGDVVNVRDGWNLVGELDYTSATGTHHPRRTYAWGLDSAAANRERENCGLVIQRDATSGDAYFPVLRSQRQT